MHIVDTYFRVQRRLRVIAGPFRGRAYDLGTEALTIGRAEEANVRIGDPSVSRLHAKIVSDGPGSHMLVDLGSTNGTHVHDVRIQRYPLEPGTRFIVGRCTFVYEVGASEGAGAPSLGGTARPGGEPHAAGRSGPDTGSDRPAIWGYVVATRSNGSAYEGSLVDDIVEYRDLRARRVQGLLLDAESRSAFEQLHARLRERRQGTISPTDGLARFSCEFAARLRVDGAPGPGLPCLVRAVGVEGAQIECGGSIPARSTATLIILHCERNGEQLELPCRVHLGLGGRLELSFSGTARATRGHYQKWGSSITEPRLLVSTIGDDT